MGYKVIVLNSAKKDLGIILDYIKHQLENPLAAKTFLENVKKVKEQLTRTPLMYALIDDEKLRLSGYRKVVINNYIMIYKVDEEKKTINILRFFFGHRDYTRYM
jgi:addiction module RelE/StbE family toxin